MPAVQRAVHSDAHPGSATAGELPSPDSTDATPAGDQHGSDHLLTDHADQSCSAASHGRRSAATGIVVTSVFCLFPILVFVMVFLVVCFCLCGCLLNSVKLCRFSLGSVSSLVLECLNVLLSKRVYRTRKLVMRVPENHLFLSLKSCLPFLFLISGMSVLSQS